jgi:hypothetical protein
MSLIAIALAAVLTCQGDPALQEVAIARLRELGANVAVGPAPDSALVVGLTGSSDPAACMGQLKHLLKLHTLDL